MNHYLQYRFAQDRIQEMHKQAEVARLVPKQAYVRVRLSKLFYALAKRLEPKTEVLQDISL
jgi:hypothetical protein